MEQEPIGLGANWEQDAGVQNTLELLGRQSVLIAVTLQTWRASRQFEITVSKGLTEAGQWAGQYWWEVDRLAEEDRDSARRERRWALGLRPYDTAEAAYEAAVQAVAEQTAGASAGAPVLPA